MNRIDALFARQRDAGRKTLMPFITAGDPDLPTTAALLPALEKGGASIVEVGIPFSDPIADGPVIQASMSRALDKGVKVEQVFEAVANTRDKTELGLVAMVSYSIVYRMGLERFTQDAAAAGFDGFIFPDLPVEEADAARDAAGNAGLILSLLIAPTTPIERAQRIASASTGFVYVLSRSGITGERAELPPELPERLRKLRDVTDLPLAVGFGVSGPDQVRSVVSVADAAIVGTAMVRKLQSEVEAGADVSQVAKRGEAFTRELASGLADAGQAGSDSTQGMAGSRAGG